MNRSTLKGAPSTQAASVEQWKLRLAGFLAVLAVLANTFFGPGATRDSTVEAYQELRSLIRKGDLEAAATKGREFLSRHPGDPFLCTAQLDALTRLGNHAEAEAVARKTLSYNDTLLGVRMQLARTLGRLGRYGEADREMTAVLERVPENAVAQLLRAELLGEAGQTASAIAHLREVIVAHPKTIPARLLLARIYRRAGEPEAALATVRVAWGLARGQVKILREYEQIFMSMGDEGRADRVRRARQDAVNERRPIPAGWDPEAAAAQPE